MIEEVQIELGIVSYQKRSLAAFQQPAELLRRRLLFHPLCFQLFRRNAGEVRNEGRQGPSRSCLLYTSTTPVKVLPGTALQVISTLCPTFTLAMSSSLTFISIFR